MSVRTHNSQSSRKGNLSIVLTRWFMSGHIALYHLTKGVIGGKIGKFSFLLLTTIGHKSGQQRVTPLFYISDESRFLVIASNWGSEKLPTWWVNLQAHPQAMIQVGRRQISVSATQADPQERATLWPNITAKYPFFADYQRRLSREIPVVILTPDA